MSRIRKDTEAPEWVTEPEEAPKLPPAYRPFPERRWERSKPTDRCGVPGCDKTVGEHQAELEVLLRRLDVKAVKL